MKSNTSNSCSRSDADASGRAKLCPLGTERSVGRLPNRECHLFPGKVTSIRGGRGPCLDRTVQVTVIGDLNLLSQMAASPTLSRKDNKYHAELTSPNLSNVHVVRDLEKQLTGRTILFVVPQQLLGDLVDFRRATSPDSSHGR